MPKYTFEWSKTTTYSTVIEADSETDAHEDLMNDITAQQTDFTSDITDEVFDVPEESSGVMFTQEISQITMRPTHCEDATRRGTDALHVIVASQRRVRL